MNPVIIHFFINWVVLILAVFLIRELYKRYYIPARFLKYKFRYFALRDRLGHLAIEDKIDSEGKTYKFLVSTLNSYIKYTENVDFLDFLKAHIKLEQNPEYKIELEKLISNSKKLSPEVAKLMKDFESLTLQIIYKNSFILKTILKYHSINIFANKIIEKARDTFLKATLNILTDQQQRIERLST